MHGGTADALSRLSPDLLVVLGDRYEMLTVASAALIFRIPIVHIAGGEISEGAYDDSIRHAITKMASLHLTATEENRNRVIQMGEEPQRVINTGAIGVYNIIHEPVMSREELEESIGMTVDRNTLLVTYHPATLDPTPVNQQCAALPEALDRFPDNNVIITYPNSDTAGQVIIDMIERYAATRQHRVKVVPSLGKRRYLSALHYAGAVVGNSSSGIVEVPSMHIPTVDIGIRQRGRLAASSVRHYSCTPDDIARGIAYSLSEEGRNEAAVAENPYAKPDTLRLIVDAITNTPLSEAIRQEVSRHSPLTPQYDRPINTLCNNGPRRQQGAFPTKTSSRSRETADTILGGNSPTACPDSLIAVSTDDPAIAESQCAGRT